MLSLHLESKLCIYMTNSLCGVGRQFIYLFLNSIYFECYIVVLLLFGFEGDLLLFQASQVKGRQLSNP